MTTLLLLVAMVISVGPGNLIRTVKSIDLVDHAVLFALTTVIQGIRALRAYLLICASPVPYLTMFAYSCLHQISNHLVPMRAGEAAFPILLKKLSNVSYTYSIAKLILFRFIDVVALLAIMGFVAVFVLSVNALIAILIVIGVVAACIAALYFGRWLVRATHRVTQMRFPKSMRSTRHHLEKMLATLVEESRFSIFLSALFSTFVWVLFAIIFARLLILSDAYPGFARTLLSSNVAHLTQLLPINTIGGFGVIEAGWTISLVQFGVDWRSAMAVGLTAHVLVFLYQALWAGIALLYVRRARSGTN